MALAESLHHSAQRPEKAGAREVEEQDQHEALRRQTVPPPGKRPEPLEEVSEPQAGIRRHTGVGFELVLDPVVPQLAREDERQVVEEWVELVDEHTGNAFFWNPLSGSTSWSRPKRKRKKRKKRRKRRTSRTSSRPSRGRRQHRQWHAPGWFPRFSALHAVFPSFVGRPKMLGILVGMDQKDSSMVALVGMDQKDSSQRHSFGFFWEFTSGQCFVFSAMLGSTVDTISAAAYKALRPPVLGRHLFGAGCCW